MLLTVRSCDRTSQDEIDGGRAMRSSTLIMIAVAAVFGLLAVFVSQAWLNRQAEARLRSLEAQKPVTVATRTLVVAHSAA